MKRVVVLGGSGIFGGRIAKALASDKGLAVRIAGRGRRRGEHYVHCALEQPQSLAACLDGCDLLIHAAGPFQGRDYAVARACIERGVHYLDLADARDFVCGIGVLHADALARGIVVGSGASSVPTITWALISELAPEFAAMDSIQIALSPGNQNPRGASTIGAILGYLGQPMRVWIDGQWRVRYGWGDRIELEFPPNVGVREVFRCEVPDLDLFPTTWNAGSVQFDAGLELRGFNRALSALAALRRMHLVPRLERLAPLCLRVSLWFFSRGSKNGALAVWLRGRSPSGESIERKIALVTDDDGPATPSCPAILLARKLLLGAGLAPGARTCMGLLTLTEIRAHLEPLGIWCARSGADGRWSLP
jgi:saccharopine dehydrogenase-like NADP-dependent oxidoreductase